MGTKILRVFLSQTFFRVFLEEVKKIPEKNKKRILMIVELREIMILQQK